MGRIDCQPYVVDEQIQKQNLNTPIHTDISKATQAAWNKQREQKRGEGAGRTESCRRKEGNVDGWGHRKRQCSLPSHFTNVERGDKYDLQRFGLFFSVALGRMMRRDGRNGRGIVGAVLGWIPFGFLRL